MNDLILEQVTKGFGDHVVLREFSARFPGGQCTCIMGPSGCGKTTLLRLILGLEQPDSGRILGQTFPMAAVFQENRLFEDFSALSNVTAVCPRERRSEAAQHLIALGLGRAFTPPSAP
ncbi:MAG: ATP-binding cassette domain-containing protein [Evtepia sp.]